MPDDMLEDAIAISKKTLDEHDFETDGVGVRKAAYIRVWKLTTMILNVDCQESEEVYGWEVGAILARIPGEIIRLPLGARAQPLCVFHIRTKQDLIPHLQSIVNKEASGSTIVIQNRSLLSEWEGALLQPLYRKQRTPDSFTINGNATFWLLFVLQPIQYKLSYETAAALRLSSVTPCIQPFADKPSKVEGLSSAPILKQGW